MVRTLSAFELKGLGARVDDDKTRKEGVTAMQVAEMGGGGNGNKDRRNGNDEEKDGGCGSDNDDEDGEWLELFRGLIAKLRAAEGTYQSPSSSSSSLSS